MSDDALIRLQNLRATKLTPTELVRRVGSTSSYWSDMLKGNKSFGEKTARKIEAGLGMPRGSLDESHTSAVPKEVTTQAEISAPAMELAVLFDMIPASDVISRAQAHSDAQKAILAVLRALPEKQPASQHHQKRSA